MGVKKRKRGWVSAKWRIEIQNRKGLEMFANSIGFVVNDKTAKLESVLNSYTSLTSVAMIHEQKRILKEVMECR